MKACSERRMTWPQRVLHDSSPPSLSSQTSLAAMVHRCKACNCGSAGIATVAMNHKGASEGGPYAWKAKPTSGGPSCRMIWFIKTCFMKVGMCFHQDWRGFHILVSLGPKVVVLGPMVLTQWMEFEHLPKTFIKTAVGRLWETENTRYHSGSGRMPVKRQRRSRNRGRNSGARKI